MFSWRPLAFSFAPKYRWSRFYVLSGTYTTSTMASFAPCAQPTGEDSGSGSDGPWDPPRTMMVACADGNGRKRTSKTWLREMRFIARFESVVSYHVSWLQNTCWTRLRTRIHQSILFRAVFSGLIHWRKSAITPLSQYCPPRCGSPFAYFRPLEQCSTSICVAGTKSSVAHCPGVLGGVVERRRWRQVRDAAFAFYNVR